MRCGKYYKRRLKEQNNKMIYYFCGVISTLFIEMLLVYIFILLDKKRDREWEVCQGTIKKGVKRPPICNKPKERLKQVQ